MSINISLTPQLEDMVRQKVAEGLYTDASGVIIDALRLMEAQDRLVDEQFDDVKLAALREDLLQGIRSGPAGELDIDAIKRRGRAKLLENNR